MKVYCLLFRARCLVVQANAVTICPTAVWNLVSTTVAGSPLGTSGSTSALLSRPTNVFVDGNGAIYVSDLSNYRVQKWLLNDTTGITVAGGSSGTGLHQFNYSECNLN